MTFCFNTAAVALAFIFTIPTAYGHGNLEHTAISGWYPACDLDGDSFAESCLGTFVESAEPAELDLTGETCYVNPIDDSTTSAGVFWFGPLPNNTGTYMFSSLLLGENVTKFKPTNCSANGACDCGPFDALRGDDWMETGKCGASCGISNTDTLDGRKGEDCAIDFKITTEYMNETVGICPILGKVIDTLPPSTSGVVKKAMVFSGSWTVAVLVAFIM